MEILIVEDEPIIRQFCTLILENNFSDCNITEAVHANDAIDILNSGKQFDFIISDYDMTGGNGDVLVQHLKTINWSKAYLLHTSNSIEDLPYMEEFVNGMNNRSYAQKPVRLKELTDIIKTIINKDVVENEFHKVRISYFLRGNKALCDIYIQLNESKHVKIINSGDYYKKTDIDKYIKKNQKYLHLLKDDFESFANSYTQTPFLEFIDDLEGNVSGEENLVRLHAVLKDLVESVGVDQYAIRLADSYVKTVGNIADSDKSISEMLFKLRQRRDYIYDHSYMTACIGTFIVKQLPWCTNEIIEKLCFASLFHDITLSNPELAMIHDLDDSKVRHFSAEEKKQLANHPQSACDLLKGQNNFSQDIENIIMNHHENGEGTGFPRKLDGSLIRPLSCVFIVAHEFVRQLYLHDFSEQSHKDILTVLFNNYNTGNFKDVLDALYKTLDLNDLFEEGS
jgi:response regulator RpfG family c-di-GMP phosphodiesterase